MALPIQSAPACSRKRFGKPCLITWFASRGSSPGIAEARDWYMALAYTVRDRMLERWVSTVRTYASRDVKVVCYLSAEFLDVLD
ncbi:MAG TPA: hypothetical protein VK934_11360 [Fimbriimonas sp.]|nr:hypothetical protein [Fimbriimonas sp.]